MPDHTQLNQSLDGGLLAYNKSQQSSLKFLEYGRFVILGTLGMSEHAWKQLVNIVAPILNSECVCLHAKKLCQSKLSFFRYFRIVISDNLGTAGTSSLHPTKLGVISGALKVYLHIKSQNNSA